jgi:hypothetical protein
MGAADGADRRNRAKRASAGGTNHPEVPRWPRAAPKPEIGVRTTVGELIGAT